MAKRTITSAQNRAAKTGFLDLMGESSENFKEAKFSNIIESLDYLGAVYEKKLKDQLVKKDADSSGALSDSIKASDVKVFGNVYTVEISTLKYAKFVDEGVDGWAKSRGSKYKFKRPKKRSGSFSGTSPFVESLKKYLEREGKIGAIKNRPVSARESKRARITDATTKSAIRAASMIKRFGIKPTRFFKDATTEMRSEIAKEFSAALRIDIIENITK